MTDVGARHTLQLSHDCCHEQTADGRDPIRRRAGVTEPGSTRDKKGLSEPGISVVEPVLLKIK